MLQIYSATSSSLISSSHLGANNFPQNYKFEGKERDAETSIGPGNTNGNDDFGARYYSNRFGRWLSADWSAVPVPVPYANLSNPQTLNLYAMVSDDPNPSPTSTAMQLSIVMLYRLVPHKVSSLRQANAPLRQAVGRMSRRVSFQSGRLCDWCSKGNWQYARLY